MGVSEGAIFDDAAAKGATADDGEAVGVAVVGEKVAGDIVDIRLFDGVACGEAVTMSVSANGD